MSGLISSLNNSAGAIKVHSKGLEIVGKNLANINNRGYSKQRVEIGDRGSINTGIATESMGVEAMELRQNRDALLDKSVMREITSTSSLEAAKKILESAETALGQFLDRTKDSTSIQNAPGSNGGGISDALSDFFNAWESFSVKPNDVGEKQLLIAKAQILAEKINATDKRLAQVQTDADNQITTDVGVVNDLLAEIAKNNEYIAKAELVKPFSAVDLRDQRQAKLEELAKYIDVSFEPDVLGQIIVKSGDSTLIKGNKVTGQTINTDGSKTGPFGYNVDKWEIVLIGKTFSGNGKLGAQLDAAKENVQTAREQIAGLAIKLRDEVNTTYGGTAPLFTISGGDATGTLNLQFNTSKDLSAGSNGGNKVALKIASLGTIQFSADELILTDDISSLAGKTVNVSGGGKNLDGGNYTVQQIGDSKFRLLDIKGNPVNWIGDITENTSLNLTESNLTINVKKLNKTNFNGSFASNFNKTVTILGQELNTTKIRLEDQKLSENMAVANRDQFSGVSQDEEMTDMMKFQRSFQASARHISVIDELLDLVVNRLGRF